MDSTKRSIEPGGGGGHDDAAILLTLKMWPCLQRGNAEAREGRRKEMEGGREEERRVSSRRRGHRHRGSVRKRKTRGREGREEKAAREKIMRREGEANSGRKGVRDSEEISYSACDLESSEHVHLLYCFPVVQGHFSEGFVPA
eukprot:3503430-Rhodomonas_salina.1